MTDWTKLTNDKVVSRVIRRHMREGRPENANVLIAAWGHRAPHMALPMALQALLELSADHVEQAKGQAQAAVTVDVQCALGYFALAQVYARETRWDDALVAAQRACSLQPDDGDFGSLLAQLHASRGDTAQAEQALRRVLSSGGEGYPAAIMLAEILLLDEHNDLREIEALVRQGCEVSPHTPQVWALYGRVLAAMGDIVRARERLELALTLDPDHPLYLLQLSELNFKSAGTDPVVLKTAEGQARRTVALAPQEWRGGFLLSQILRAQGRWAEALGTLSAAAKAAPETRELLMELADLCVDVGQFTAGKDALERAIALGAPPSWVSSMRTALLLRQGDWPGACAETESGIASGQPGDRILAAPLEERGLPVEAIGFSASGVADCLVYVRFAEAIAARGTKVVLIAPAPLGPFLARVSGVDSVRQSDEGLHFVESIQRMASFAGAAALVSPANGPYLMANPASLGEARHRRSAHAGPCVAVEISSMPVAWQWRLGHWLAAHNALVVVIGESRPAWLPEQVPIAAIGSSDIEALAAWTACADAVVSGDTPLAHLAGGMGFRAEVLLPIGHDPLWASHPTQAYLHPTVRLYRESLTAGWNEAWGALERSLEAQLGQLGGAGSPGNPETDDVELAR